MSVVVRVLVYSDNADTRGQVLVALGTRLRPDLPELEFVQAATAAAAIAEIETGRIDLAVLDGEAAPVGGMGLAKQLRDEVNPCPPLVVLIAREADRWLADWSRAQAAVRLPVDPIELGRVVTDLLRGLATPQ
ncbi:hypothetical protein GOHSU_22_00700 [Gordonia hirsuta DSM 44140 = NBRC 16056]|uniref:Response regulatory domain-containing protein n=1 Tax=Gordonia hirsuta DSM 44140 = NBRC 16056 TaxID=1121927 RepID=L7L8Y6_9ACTN|nr:hypothetical protein [Gordonia hirsuta]GAC57610.1 hypothetical protein GOHSU_22_00700 [Gordonia hirsuta DSM 44140 = NBRC 16056]